MEKLFSKFRSKIALLILVVLPSVIMAQSSPVTGTVYGNDGEGIPGVLVIEKGTENGTVTDIDGMYSIVLKSTTSVLAFHLVGMTTQEKPVKSGDVMNVVMQEDVSMLEQVVVTGYTSQKKADLTGAV
ncbi:MAG: carboxypeptidase-like regulatory domain-containing protein [Dysgonamonadaceae bacterium]|jgi:predicted acyltransferase|nr:carboxypeptidase-like regulatory domain-containing protein [Dysgonamonadaceae bacterium]